MADYEVSQEIGINLPTRTSDPSSPVEGTIWHRSDLDEIHKYLNGQVEVVAKVSDTATASRIIASVTGINGKTVGNTNVLTVPAGKEAVVTQIAIKLNTISGGGAVPKISVGAVSAAFNDILANQSISGLTVVGNIFLFQVQGVFRVAQATEVITLRVNNAATYTTYTFDVDLIGYTI